MSDLARAELDNLLAGCGIREKYQDEIRQRFDEAVRGTVYAASRDHELRLVAAREARDRIAGLEGALETAAKVTRAAHALFMGLSIADPVCVPLDEYRELGAALDNAGADVGDRLFMLNREGDHA